MESLISTFHLDVKLLVAQIINFAIVFLILYFLIFRPLFTVTAKRTETIDRSLKEAKEIEERLAQTKGEQKRMLVEAKKEAALILEETNRQAEERKQSLVAKAKEEIGQLINREKANMQTEKAETLRQIRAEVGDMIRLSWEKILAEKINKTTDEKIITKALKDLK